NPQAFRSMRQKAQCTSAPFRSLIIHRCESARQRARDLANTEEFTKAQRQRKKVEALFAELKNQIGLRRLRLRRLKFVREQFFLAAAAQNIKRLVSLSQPTDNTCFASYHVVEVRKINSARPCSPLKNILFTYFFNTHAC